MLFRAFRSFIRNYFTLTKRELKGTLILLSILTIQIVFLIVNKNFIPDPIPTNVTLVDPQTYINESPKTHEGQSLLNDKERSLTILHSFDPNKMNMDEWVKIGLPEKLSRTIINYLKHGGSFQKKEDLMKIYGMDQQHYLQLEPYILISKKVKSVAKPSNKSFKRNAFTKTLSVVSIELNNADQEDLESLPMIGVKRAQQILKYRAILGGFIHINQLLEVYSIDSSVFEVIKDRISVDFSKVVPININTTDSLYHPYLSKKQAVRVLNYRKNHGSFQNKADVCAAALLNDKLCAKIAPYIKLDEAANQQY